VPDPRRHPGFGQIAEGQGLDRLSAHPPPASADDVDVLVDQAGDHVPAFQSITCRPAA
jgi:hypothetical protein